MSKFKVGDKVRWSDEPNGRIHTVTATLSSGEIRIDGESNEFPASSFKAANSCASSNPVVQNALKACNMNDGVEIDERDVKAGKYREYWVTREPSMNPSGWTYRAFTYKPMLVRGMELVKNSTASNAEVAKNADDNYKAIANETRKVLTHLKAADDITVANVLKSIRSNPELASKANAMWKHISEARKIANFIIQYSD